MEARLTGGQTAGGVTTSGINPRELTPDTYQYYCRLYLIEHIAKVIPSTSFTEYGHVAKLINCIDPVLFRNLQSETMKILLLNQIYALFMESTNEEISKEFLYEKISHIANYDPALYQ